MKEIADLNEVTLANKSPALTKTVRIDVPPPAARTADPAAVASAVAKSRQALLARQFPDGYWVGELEGDSILESEYILLRFILGHDNDPDLPLIGNWLRRLQQPDGGWNLYSGGPPDLSGTVKAYFALKLLGDSPDTAHMVQARNLVRQLGGAQKANSFSRFYLAALGQISYDACPSIPPEMILLPQWLYFNMYAVSAWTRTMILPLAIVSTFRPTRKLSPRQGISELFTGPADTVGTGLEGLPTSWRDIFLILDDALKIYNRAPLPAVRKKALADAEKWMLDHMEGSESLGAIFPPMVYVLIALRALGYADHHPRVVEAHAHLRNLFIREGDSIRVQPCLSPVWDSAIAMHALAETEVEPDSEPIQRATHWLLGKECRHPRDWTVNCPGVEPSGWFFEFHNPHYPDVDDTAMVAMALKQLGGPVAEPAVKRGVNWVLAMQNEDGGWAAFDRTRDRKILEHVPFADHNALQDPSCPDITGRVLDCLAHCGMKTSHPAVRRAVRFIRHRQEPAGCWFGRWGVNYIYGSWLVLTGLQSIGERMDQPYIRKADRWLRSCQKPDGSWGESCESYDNPALKGQGPATPSQTAWGAMALMATAGPRDPAVQKALQWLLDHQLPTGSWDEHFNTGTGFPKVFYLKYHLYRLYFPLMALARYRRLIEN